MQGIPLDWQPDGLGSAALIGQGQLNLNGWPVTGSASEPGDNLGNRAMAPVHRRYVP